MGSAAFQPTPDALEQLVVEEHEALGRRDRMGPRYAFQAWRRVVGPGPIDRLKILDFARGRRAEGAAPATVSRDLAWCRRGLRLAWRLGLIETVPPLPTLARARVRMGFFEEAAFRDLHAHLPAGLDDAALFAFRTAWRRGEVLGLRWSEVDMARELVRLPGARSKNGHGRLFPFGSVPDLKEMLVRRWQRRRGPYVFTLKGGSPIGINRFRILWRNATKEAGCPKALFHDLRRSGARNMVRAGINEKLVMQLGGWQTPEMLHRYDVTSERDLEHAAEMLGAAQAELP